MGETPHNYLRDWRRAQELTLQELCDLTGYSRSYMSRLERGERAVPPLARVVMARRLGVSVAELFPVDLAEVPQC